MIYRSRCLALVSQVLVLKLEVWVLKLEVWVLKLEVWVMKRVPGEVQHHVPRSLLHS